LINLILHTDKTVNYNNIALVLTCSSSCNFTISSFVSYSNFCNNKNVTTQINCLTRKCGSCECIATWVRPP